MLYDFHSKQNAKIPGSVHATYLLSGILRPVETSVVSTGRHVAHDGEDVVMQSSPFMSSAPHKEQDSLEGEKVRVTDILLVKQEDLQRELH